MDTILLLHLGDVGVGVGERSAHGSVHPTRPCPLLGHCNVDREGGRAAGLREKQGLDLTESRSSRVLNLSLRQRLDPRDVRHYLRSSCVEVTQRE